MYILILRQQETENREIQRQTDTQTKRRCRSEVYLDRFSAAGFWVCRKLVLLFLLIHRDPTVANFCSCLSAIRIVQARSFTHTVIQTLANLGVNWITQPWFSNYQPMLIDDSALLKGFHNLLSAVWRLCTNIDYLLCREERMKMVISGQYPSIWLQPTAYPWLALELNGRSCTFQLSEGGNNVAAILLTVLKWKTNSAHDLSRDNKNDSIWSEVGRKKHYLLLTCGGSALVCDGKGMESGITTLGGLSLCSSWQSAHTHTHTHTHQRNKKRALNLRTADSTE